MPRCLGKTKDGKRCKKNAGSGKYCWSHYKTRPIKHGPKISKFTSDNGIIYKVGQALYPLTIKRIKENSWNPKTGRFTPIEYHSTQTFGANRLRIMELRKPSKEFPYGEMKIHEEFDDPEREFFPKVHQHHITHITGETFQPTGTLIKNCRQRYKNWIQNNK